MEVSLFQRRELCPHVIHLKGRWTSRDPEGPHWGGLGRRLRERSVRSGGAASGRGTVLTADGDGWVLTDGP